ncbi:MAG: fasciclin domain-containing protein [Acidimicrobiales bacterium]|nr:fasciclin domain-containing protein [Acidimicrobiales bacterium]
MKKNTRIAVSMLMTLGLVAAACGSDEADSAVDGSVVETTEVVEETPEETEPASDDEMAEEASDDEMAEEASDDAMAEEDGEMAEEPATVVDIALSSPDFSILVEALTAADLVETLQGSGPFTVFAPTNDAFAQALTDLNLTKEELLASPDLAGILTYHVVPALVDSGAAVAADGTEVPTVNGDTIAVSVVDGSVMVDGATVTTVDLMAGNGIVHVIDSVILPG